MSRAIAISVLVFTVIVWSAPKLAYCGQSANRWRIMPIRSEQEFKQGKIGGEATQHLHSIAGSPSQPNIIYLSHDCGQFWRSENGGKMWIKTLGKGLYVHAGQSIEVDPVKPNIVLSVVDSAWNYLGKNHEGVYRSTDYGDSWELVLPTKSVSQRTYQHNIAYDNSSIKDSGAMRWYVGFPDNGLYRSEDGGRTWDLVSNLEGHSSLYAVHTHPKDGQTVYLGSKLGLFRSTSRGKNVHPLGNLPDGEVSAIAINPKEPGMVYAVVKGRGLYRSVDGGQTFSILRSFDATGVFINPSYPEVIYLTGLRSNIQVSLDGGRTWRSPTVIPAPGLGRNWKKKMSGPMSGVVPDPNDSNKAVAYSQAQIWKTTDAGRTFVDSSTLFTGYAWGWWNDSVAYDMQDPNKFAFFCADISLAITHNGSDWFERRRVPWEWRKKKLISWPGMYAGDIEPISGSEVIIGSVGMYWDTKLVRSDNGGRSWSIVDHRSENHLFIAFNTRDPNVVYAGNKRSLDRGKTFEVIEFLKQYDASIMGMSLSNPDTIYAISKPRNKIFRSDDKGATWRLYVQADWHFNRMNSKPTFELAPDNPDKIYTLAKDGDLAVYDGKSWEKLGLLNLAGGKQLRNYVRAVKADPRHSNIIYALMHTSGLPYVFRSENGGKTWEDITYNLPRVGGGAISVHPLTGDLMHGGCFGTWVFPPPYKSQDSIYNKLFDYKL